MAASLNVYVVVGRPGLAPQARYVGRGGGSLMALPSERPLVISGLTRAIGGPRCHSASMRTHPHRQTRAGVGRGATLVAAASSEGFSTGAKGMTICYRQIEVVTHEGVGLFDITPQIKELLAEAKGQEGFVNVISRHTTTAITINEMEGRLLDDVRQFLPRLVPPEHPYLHNDLHLRHGPEGWPGGDEAWREQEPINAHSHLQAMLLGQTETVPVHQGQLVLGTWQSVILVELDGTKGRKRTVGLQFVGSS